MVRTSYVGLCGTDTALFDGSSSYLLAGLKRYPFVFGHEWSGRVVTAADDVRGLSVGDRVGGHNFITCDTCAACRSGRRAQCSRRSEMGVLGDYPGAASRYFTVPAKVLAPLPDTISDQEAVLLEPGTTALHAITRTRVQAEDTVLIFGTGTVGLVAAQLCRARGALVEVVGVEPAGCALARELGAHQVHSPADVPEGRYSVVIEASGATAAAAQAPLALADGGRLALVGVAHHPIPEFPTAPLVLKNAEVHGVLSGIDHWDRLINLVADGAVRLAPLIGAVFPYRHADQAFARSTQPNRPRPKILLDFSQEENDGPDSLAAVRPG